MRLLQQNHLKAQPGATQFRIKSVNSRFSNISKRQPIKASSEEQQVFIHQYPSISSNSTNLPSQFTQTPPPMSPPPQPTTTPTPSSTNVCQFCGIDKSKIPRGCDQEGRVIGGMGSIPGFRWWPIKAYRPCPRAGEAGKSYSRKGQVIDEVLFGAKK